MKDARIVGGYSMKIEVECRNMEEATEAASAGCDIVLLDNLTAEVKTSKFLFLFPFGM